MNIKEYIESGILEDYVFHNVSDQQRREVECMSKIYPEIRMELERMQSSLIKFIELESTSPSQEIKARIFSSIQEDDYNKESARLNGEGAKNVIKLSNWPKYAVAAGLALTFLTAFLYYSTVKQNNVLENQIAQLNSEQKLLLDRDKKYSHKLGILSDPDYKKIKLNGLSDKDSLAYVTLLWNPNNKSVFIDHTNLKNLPNTKQYQLWALVAGTPYDMGVFDPISYSSFELIPMKNADAADAFAITIESRGGVESPTLSEMVVMGKI